MQNFADSCECQSDGHCPRYGKWMGGRLRQICRGEAAGVTAEKAAAYRALWASQAAGKPAPAAAAPGRCRHLSKRARDESGNVKTVICTAPG